MSLSKKYDIKQKKGAGAYGEVVSATNKFTKEEVAIKTIPKIFTHTLLAKRSLREIKLLRHFNGHKNITSIKDIEVNSKVKFDKVHLVQELMDYNLWSVIHEKCNLSNDHKKYILYQMSKAIKYIHSANVIHRDLKPGNVLVNKKCDVKICDFGLARSCESHPLNENMTEYVVTRWYRAPEVMLLEGSYDKPIDVWSLGCIFAELLNGKLLFQGKNHVEQIQNILKSRGSYQPKLLSLFTKNIKSFLKSMPQYSKSSLRPLFEGVDGDALDLLEKMLELDPRERITIEEILEHPYLSEYHDSTQEPTCDLFQFDFEKLDNTDDLRAEIIGEVREMKGIGNDLMSRIWNFKSVPLF